MLPRPVIIAATSTREASPAVKRTLFRSALTVAMIGTVLLSTILLVQGGLALGHLQYFVDIGQHPLNVTSLILIILGLVALATFIVLFLGLIQVNRTYTLIAAGLLIGCSLALIAFSIWSFVTVISGGLPSSIRNALIDEIEKTKFSYGQGNQIIVENSETMARLEKQHRCCGLNDSVDDYRSRQQSAMPQATSGSGNKPGNRPSGSQRNPTQSDTVVLPISCCNEIYRSPDNLCVDIYRNSSNTLSRYNTDGCFETISRDKFQRIQQQGFTTVVAACLAVISSIALAAVIRLVAAGHQVGPLPRPS